MIFRTLENVFAHELQDAYSAETQLLDALPIMAQAADCGELREAFESHLTETRTQRDRVEQILSTLGHPAEGETCKAMKGLIKEGADIIEHHEQGVLRDVALIAAAQRVEHYEIAVYGTAKALAKHLGLDEAADLLDKNLDEEGNADNTLSKIAEGGWVVKGLNQEAASK